MPTPRLSPSGERPSAVRCWTPAALPSSSGSVCRVLTAVSPQPGDSPHPSPSPIPGSRTEGAPRLACALCHVHQKGQTRRFLCDSLGAGRSPGVGGSRGRCFLQGPAFGATVSRDGDARQPEGLSVGGAVGRVAEPGPLGLRWAGMSGPRWQTGPVLGWGRARGDMGGGDQQVSLACSEVGSEVPIPFLTGPEGLARCPHQLASK